MACLFCCCCCQGNEDEGGTWYRKSDTPQEETLGSQTGKKTQKKEGKGRNNAVQQAST